jgi:hypothetical protein
MCEGTGDFMASKIETPQKMTITVIIWSNILRQQYLQDISDKRLSMILGVTGRSLYNYRQDIKRITDRIDVIQLEINGRYLP